MHKFIYLPLMAVACLAQRTAAQTTPHSDTTAAIFNTAKVYNTWSIGANAGLAAPLVVTGGSNDFSSWKAGLGYGASLRWQAGYVFGLQADVRGARLNGSNTGASASFSHLGTVGGSSSISARSFSTDLYSVALSGVANLGSIDFLHRRKSITFFADAGAGIVYYQPAVTADAGNVFDYGHHLHSLVIPVGAGIKFRLTDRLALNAGYTENFVDGDQLDGLDKNYPTKDKYGYSYAGLEVNLGSRAKKNLDWVNPVTLIYDQIRDTSLRQEVEALRRRITNAENAVADLKKDSDGDGVSDQFDKCPNTPAGVVVDGAGCEIRFPQINTDSLQRKYASAPPTSFQATSVSFDFDSSVLRTSSYNALDVLSSNLRDSPEKMIDLNGYTSTEEGTEAHKLRLSKDRANSVKTYLVNSGVDAKRIKVKGYGEITPVASNATEEGRMQNRRVEFAVSTTIIFEAFKSDITPNSMNILNDVALVIKNSRGNSTITINAQTNWDERSGDTNRDRALCIARGTKVRTILISKGIAGQRIIIVNKYLQPGTQPGGQYMMNYRSVTINY